MASDDLQSDSTEGPSQMPAAPSKRPASRRRNRRLMVALVIIAAALVVILWGWTSTGGNYLEVGTLVDDAEEAQGVPEEYLSGSIEIRGIVADWDGTPTDLDFTLIDGDEPTKSIRVFLNGTLPEGFENGKSTVAKGHLESTLPLTLEATELTIGCSSKY